MTVGFVRGAKAYLLPAVLGDVYSFRKAYLTLDGVLRSLFEAISGTNGTARAVSALRARHEDASVDCMGFHPKGFGQSCPWGLLSFVEEAGALAGVNATISEAEVCPCCKPRSCRV